MKTHRLSGTPTYGSWMNMWTRCTNKRSDRYHYYGAKGITVDERWRSFEAFVEDMGMRPDGCTLDRINGSEGYTKANCRWATNAVQSNNKDTNVRYTFECETKTVAEWGLDKRSVCDGPTLRARLSKGWSIEQALFEPIGADPLGNRHPRDRKDTVWITIMGDKKALQDWVDDPRCRCKEATFRFRIKGGMDPYLALITPASEKKSHKRTKHVDALLKEKVT